MAAVAAVGGVADAELRADFVTSFDGLSEGVQAAIAAELPMPEPGYVREASTEDIELFATTEEGEALVSDWGGPGSRRAARNVAIIKGKMRAAIDRMTEAEREEFGVWFDGLTPGEARSALRAIVTV
jgi:hypothetical protein